MSLRTIWNDHGDTIIPVAAAVVAVLAVVAVVVRSCSGGPISLARKFRYEQHDYINFMGEGVVHDPLCGFCLDLQQAKKEAKR